MHLCVHVHMLCAQHGNIARHSYFVVFLFCFILLFFNVGFVLSGQILYH